MSHQATVALVGLDGAMPGIIRRLSEEGVLQNIARLIKEGAVADGLPSFPTSTSTNWTTISTGAPPRTHGVTDMTLHVEGDDLPSAHSAFDSRWCMTERIWDTAAKNGKKVILLKYPCSWPPTSKKILQVEGYGAPSGPGDPKWGRNPLEVSPPTCYTTLDLQKACRVAFSPPLSSADRPGTPAPTATIRVGPKGRKLTYTVSLGGPTPGVYERVLVRSGQRLVADLGEGDWSPWIRENFGRGAAAKEATFRLKLVSLSTDGSDFRLYATQVFPTNGWTFPEYLSRELLARVGPFVDYIGHWPHVFGWIDDETYLEIGSYQASWLSRASALLLKKYQPDLLMTQWHGIDYTQHAFLRLDQSDYAGEAERTRAWGLVKRSYQIADGLVGDIANQLGKRGTIMVVSDHGASEGKRRFMVNNYFYKMGLLALSHDDARGKWTLDAARTRAFANGLIHVFINSKDRYRKGAVEPGADYDRAVDEVVDSLYSVKDPRTGMRPIYLCLRRADADALGLGGDRTGDVVFATTPGYYADSRLTPDFEVFIDLNTGIRGGSIHGPLLPTTDLGDLGSMKGVFFAAGSGIRQGVKLERPVALTRIAPTISALMGIPLPSGSMEGPVNDILTEH